MGKAYVFFNSPNLDRPEVDSLPGLKDYLARMPDGAKPKKEVTNYDFANHIDYLGMPEAERASLEQFARGNDLMYKNVLAVDVGGKKPVSNRIAGNILATKMNNFYGSDIYSSLERFGGVIAYQRPDGSYHVEQAGKANPDYAFRGRKSR